MAISTGRRNCNTIDVGNITALAQAICDCTVDGAQGSFETLCSINDPNIFYLLFREDGQPKYVQMPIGVEFDGYPPDAAPCQQGEVNIGNITALAQAICDCFVTSAEGSFETLCSQNDPSIFYLIFREDGQPKYVQMPGGVQFDGFPADAVPCQPDEPVRMQTIAVCYC